MHFIFHCWTLFRIVRPLARFTAFLCDTVHFCYLINFYQCLSVISAIKSSLASTPINADRVDDARTIQCWSVYVSIMCIAKRLTLTKQHRAKELQHIQQKATKLLFINYISYTQFGSLIIPEKLGKEFSTTFRIKYFHRKIMHSTQ